MQEGGNKSFSDGPGTRDHNVASNNAVVVIHIPNRNQMETKFSPDLQHPVRERTCYCTVVVHKHEQPARSGPTMAPVTLLHCALAYMCPHGLKEPTYKGNAGFLQNKQTQVETGVPPRPILPWNEKGYEFLFSLLFFASRRRQIERGRL